jgi:hypothetical protein
MFNRLIQVVVLTKNKNEHLSKIQSVKKSTIEFKEVRFSKEEKNLNRRELILGCAQQNSGLLASSMTTTWLSLYSHFLSVHLFLTSNKFRTNNTIS